MNASVASSAEGVVEDVVECVVKDVAEGIADVAIDIVLTGGVVLQQYSAHVPGELILFTVTFCANPADNLT